MDEIQELIRKLQLTEEEREKSFQRLKLVIDEAVKEMINILYSLYAALHKKNSVVRSYTGKVYELEEGIVIYSRGITEKIVLNKEKRLIRYKVSNEGFVKQELTPEAMLQEIGFENLYNNIKDLLRERIKINKEEAFNFRSQASKIEKYHKDLEKEYRPKENT